MKKSKLISISDAIKQIPNGSKVAICGSFTRRHPMALVHELIRQDKRDLIIYGWNNSIDFDLLIGAGCVKEANSSYVGMGNLGSALNFRRSCQEGTICYIDHTETTALDRFFAGYQGHSFAISKTPLNTSLQIQPEYQTEILCPFTKERYVAMEAWKPDYALMHASRADEYGNVQLDRIRMMENEPDIIICKASKHIIVSVEEIVSDDEIIKNKEDTVLPKLFLDNVCLAPYGAHPNSCDARYDYDIEHGRIYQSYSSSAEGIKKYIKEFIIDTGNWDGYLKKACNIFK